MKPQPLLKRTLIGALTAILALSGLGWVGLNCNAEYRFCQLSTNIREDELNPLGLSRYELKLAALTRRDPTNAEIRNAHASVLGRQGQYARAVQELELARRTLNVRNGFYFLSSMYEKMNDIPRAEELMADCLRINPTDPEFNTAHLHLLGLRLYELNTLKLKNALKDPAQLNRYRQEYARAALNWGVRASNDKNSFLFMANVYIDPTFPNYPLAYRNFLVGLSGAPWLSLNPKAMIDEKDAMYTIRRILSGHYAKPYRNLP